MLELSFQVEGAEPLRSSAEPRLNFRLRIAEVIAEGSDPTPIHTIALSCQVRVEPTRRRYDAREQGRLSDLFGTPERWGQTVRSILWAEVNVNVPAFTGASTLDLPVPCRSDLNLATTRYFNALEGGDLPLGFLFRGTIFFEGGEGSLQVAPIPWEKEASFRLPAATWRGLMDHYYPGGAWVCLRRDLFERLDRFRSREGLPTWEEALERLLDSSRGSLAS